VQNYLKLNSAYIRTSTQTVQHSFKMSLKILLQRYDNPEGSFKAKCKHGGTVISGSSMATVSSGIKFKFKCDSCSRYFAYKNFNIKTKVCNLNVFIWVLRC